MMNTNLMVLIAFTIVFGGAFLNWWFGGGYKKWLKYRHDLQVEKNRLNKLKNEDDTKTQQNEGDRK